MRLLLTGFEPFGGGSTNPAWDCLPGLSVDGVELIKHRLPVSFSAAPAGLTRLLAQHEPDAVICLGLAAGRKKITPELVAINLAHASIPDNDGQKPEQLPIFPGGADGLFSTLPVFELARAAESAGIPAQVSYSAGAYVCNCLMYHLLTWAIPQNIPAGFVHVPETKDLPLADIACGVEAMIRFLDTWMAGPPHP